MAKRVEALVKPDLLIWARKSAGLSQDVAAKKAHVPLDKLISWESGETRPTIPQLIKLGTIYKRPISVFYLPKPPKQFDALHDYRRLPGQPAPSLSPALIFEIRRARERRQTALDLYDLLGDRPPEIDFRIHLDNDPEEVSSEIRSLLDIDTEAQKNWNSFYEAYNEWRRALDTIGVLAFQSTDSKIKLEEMRGFSISELPLPVIVVNKQDFPAPRIFSLTHELAHILLREEGICEFDKVDFIAPEEQQIEMFCNHVAGATLVPKEALLSEHAIRVVRNIDSFDDHSIRTLSIMYKVSREVILRRLLQFGYITKSFYEHKKAVYEEEAKRRAKEEAIKLAKADKKFFMPQYMKALYSNGRNYTNLILTSYYQDKITLSDVSDYLGVKLKHLPKIELAMSDSFSYA